MRLSASLFPADAALANRGGVPLGAVVHPFQTRRVTESTSVKKQPARCETCGAFVNGFCAVNARNGHWACCFCGSGNTHRSLIVPLDADAAALPELAAREVEYVWTPSRDDPKSPSDLREGSSASEGSSSSVGALRTTFSSCEPSRPPVVFVLDESLDSDESRLMRGSVARALDALPDGTRVGLVAFAGAVSAYDVQTDAALGFDGGDFRFAAASVVPGHRSPDARDLSAILDEKRGGPSRCIARLGDEGVRETLAAIVASLAPAGNKRRQGAARTRPRSFGAAVETAVAVLDGASARDAGTRDAKNTDTASRGRVIVCLGGPPTRGPGAAAADEQSEFYDAEERAARAYVETLAETVRSFLFSRDNPFPFGVTETFSARVSPRVSSRTVTPSRGLFDPLGDVLLA